jgi:hypothetical protein
MNFPYTYNCPCKLRKPPFPSVDPLAGRYRCRRLDAMKVGDGARARRTARWKGRAGAGRCTWMASAAGSLSRRRRRCPSGRSGMVDHALISSAMSRLSTCATPLRCRRTVVRVLLGPIWAGDGAAPSKLDLGRREMVVPERGGKC